MLLLMLLAMVTLALTMSRVRVRRWRGDLAVHLIVLLLHVMLLIL